MNIGKVSHWTLAVGDVERSLAFYTEVLGWCPVSRSPDGSSVRLVRDGQRVELVESPATRPATTRPAINHLGLSHMTVATGPAPAAMEALERRHVPVRRHTLANFVPGAGDEETQFLFEDPDGNLIETFVAEGDDWSPFGSIGGSDAEPSTAGVRHLSHWSLCVAQPERSLAFYRDLLGWQELAVMEWEGEGPSRVMDVGPARLTTWLMAAGDQRIEIIHFDRPPVERRTGAGIESTGLSHLTLEVDDLGAAAEELAHAGVSTDVVEDELDRVAVGHDPDGTRICWRSTPFVGSAS